MQEQNNQPAPTLPNKDIFNQAQVAQPVQQPPAGTEMVDKKKIISGVGGKPKFSSKIFIFLGIVIFILLLAVVAKALFKGGANNGEVKITWWGLYESEEAVKPLIEEYRSKNPNVTIDYIKQSQQDYRERLANAITTGKGPDIFQFHNSWVPMFMNSLIANPTDYSSIFYPVVSIDLRSKDGFLGIPLEYDGIALYVNQDIMRTYGKNPPKTWDDLRKTAIDLTVREQTGGIRQSGAALGVTGNIDYWQDILALLMLQNGANPKDVMSLEAQSALTFYTNFSKVDSLWDESLPEASTYFSQGKLAMYFGKYSDAFVFNKDPNLHFQVVTLPQLPGVTSTSNSVSYASYWANGVSKASRNSEVAWDFLNFMTSKESLSKLYKSLESTRGYGNLYPRVDMQSELLSDPIAGPFIYQASFARSWYLNDKTFDGASGINTQVAKPFADTIAVLNLAGGTVDQAVEDLQVALTTALANYGLVARPLPTQ